MSSKKPQLSFLLPPAPLRVGGLDVAINGLADALGTAGWKVSLIEEASPLPSATELLHIHGIWRPKAARMAKEATRNGIPYLVSPHGMLEPWARRSKRIKKTLYFQIIERSMLANAATILCTSAQEKQNLADFAPELGTHCEAIPLGIDPPPEVAERSECRHALGLDPKEKILLYLSRIDRKKGLDLLLQALAKTAGNHKFDRLLVVGDGDTTFLRELQEFASEASASLPPIDWVGAVWGEKKWMYLKVADLFCLPTHSENFGFAVLEAALMGTPVLTTENTPWGEWGAGMEGIHLTQTTTDAIGRALCHLTDKLPEASTSGLTLWARENFLWEKVVSRYETMYLNVLGPAPD